MIEYSFYTDIYHGHTLSAEEWPMYAAQAVAKLGYYKRTYKVSAPDEAAENMAVCSMAETIAYYAQGGGSVSSATIGSVSVSYGSENKSEEKAIYSAARIYIDIYRGALK